MSMDLPCAAWQMSEEWFNWCWGAVCLFNPSQPPTLLPRALGLACMRLGRWDAPGFCALLSFPSRNLKERPETRLQWGAGVGGGRFSHFTNRQLSPKFIKRSSTYCPSFLKHRRHKTVSDKTVTGSWDLGAIIMKVVLLIVYLCM